MKIKKIINNNAVYLVDDNNKEIIAFGSGIGWNKNNNDIVIESKIEKVFVLKDQSYNHVSKLLERVTPESLEFATRIWEKSQEILKKEIDDQIVFTLADHITFSIQSYYAGSEAINLILHEVKLLYPTEYKIGEFGVKLINETLNISLPDDEIGYIALHMVNAGVADSSFDVNIVITLTQDIRKIIIENYGNVIDENSFEYIRFLTHIKYLARRICGSETTKVIKVDELLPVLTSDVKIKKTLDSIKKIVYEKYDYDMQKEDELYLIMHILRVVN
ncbi:PRD domain-containing protein [Breznakia pachnodae]|uniref:Beta-glucoside operon transcriptional antiterminator n=1 Tax=Breznakia pachnodae TaxID=265178 RepID=A0ABU0E313_9FIRM|nr:PRD domain-containing protein [Breznakia pachnodae]MDQ0360890.1 beta-glucoside operon transcriptional antiterminator [Breznakia pachnodae]